MSDTVQAARGLGPVTQEVYSGVDISIDQGRIDFDAVARSGIRVIYMRAGIGRYVDGNFARNAEGAKAAGISFGCYFYTTATDTTEAVAQADFFVQLLSRVDDNCRPAMDFESYRGYSAARINEVGLAFLRRVQNATGIVPLMYTDAYAADTLWTAPYGGFPLWAADWGARLPDIRSGIWDGWAGFQYSDEGRITGIPARVDLDRFSSFVFSDANDTHRGYILYTVRRGDTLWAISRRYGTTVEAIVQLNDIANPNLIYPGQVLRIP